MIKKLHTIELRYCAEGDEEDLKMLQKYEPKISWKTKEDFVIPIYSRSREEFAGWTEEQFKVKAQQDYDNYIAQPIREFSVPFECKGFRYVDLTAFLKEKRFIPFNVVEEHGIEISDAVVDNMSIKISDVIQALHDIVRKAGN